MPLSAPARALLAGIERTGEFVFAGPGRRGHLINVWRAWQRICKAAGISGVRPHDLRHSFASSLVSGGANPPLVGQLLGHSNPATTAKYSHLFNDVQRQAVERVGAAITAAENGTPAEPPVPFPRKGRS